MKCIHGTLGCCGYILQNENADKVYGKLITDIGDNNIGE